MNTKTKTATRFAHDGFVSVQTFSERTLFPRTSGYPVESSALGGISKRFQNVPLQCGITFYDTL
jgi:hypothetical protein